jgi:CubicO group peptidase (beta-lactamase class C family)
MNSTYWILAEVPPARLAKGYTRDAAGTLTHPRSWGVGATAAAGGSFSTVRDLARWVALQLSAWPPRDAPESGPIRRDSLREMTRPQYFDSLIAEPAPETSPWLVEARTGWQGLGWSGMASCDLPLIVSHGGAEEDGYAALMAFYPTAGIGFIAMWNTLGEGSPFPPGMARAVARLLLKAGALQERRAKPNAAIVAAKERLDRLLAAWDPREASSLFDGLISDALTGSNPRADWDKLARDHGRCRPEEEPRTVGATRGIWTAMCERGKIELEVDVVSVRPPRVRSYRFREVKPDAKPRDESRCKRR